MKLSANEYLVIDLDDSLGWKLYMVKANESFYHHYQWYPDGPLPTPLTLEPKTNVVMIQLQEEWRINDADKNCDENEDYFRTGKVVSETLDEN